MALPAARTAGTAPAPPAPVIHARARVRARRAGRRGWEVDGTGRAMAIVDGKREAHVLMP